MTTDATPNPNTLPDWFERFPEPRTMPAGWDLSALTQPRVAVVRPANAPREAAPADGRRA